MKRDVGHILLLKYVRDNRGHCGQDIREKYGVVCRNCFIYAGLNKNPKYGERDLCCTKKSWKIARRLWNKLMNGDYLT